MCENARYGNNKRIMGTMKRIIGITFRKNNRQKKKHNPSRPTQSVLTICGQVKGQTSNYCVEEWGLG